MKDEIKLHPVSTDYKTFNETTAKALGVDCDPERKPNEMLLELLKLGKEIKDKKYALINKDDNFLYEVFDSYEAAYSANMGFLYEGQASIKLIENFE